MCGIVGYIGNRDAAPIILGGLRRLEYRGYDSAGICTFDGGGVQIRRCEGKLANLERLVADEPVRGAIGIGHTRWATHGRPAENNAHPHKAGPVVLVHNGIIENHPELRNALREDGHRFRSETDTEVIAHLIEQTMRGGHDFEAAVRRVLRKLKGAYALCIVCESEPDVLIAARKGSPLVVGLGTGEFFVASDIPAMLEHTRQVVYLDDEELAVFRQGFVSFSTVGGNLVEKRARQIDWSPLAAEKGGYRHFMLKEIHEQPTALRDTIAGTLTEGEHAVCLDDLRLSDRELASFERIYIIACGTSWHAAMVGKYLIEKHCRIPVEVDIASEFRYRNPVITQETLLIAISQSGETADTLGALREGRARGARGIAICNVVGSSMDREADGIIFTHAGPEIGVASTKAFVTQLAALYLFTIRLSQTLDTIDRGERRTMIADLVRLPSLVEEVLGLGSLIEEIAHDLLKARDVLYLARGINYPIALEGALKLKEISYIHAEGYAAGEMKHGPIALIDEGVPVVMLVTRDHSYEKVLANMEEVIARGGRVIGLCTEGDKEVRSRATATIELPAAGPDLMPILLAVPLQLLAYHVAVLKGTDVDQPRNLAKSVTVE
ncbi:glutamine--fructose-6-phosphate transaminase (isomerizing) [Geobacter pickeringii]|uniref:Glutamine--fructose-6-phosphate aminotransferase [isomerizing] n=1 Tax=Geobacter pickeringii TaxID=345632 RepID=A0A0B5BGR3_9BACT|nr:glutamine--fructose-6-phosphate transaminase (isomerizing) [Geobacter pickeringii]AJE03241.1 glutamine amidotransferase [Geobacter pickeringii]